MAIDGTYALFYSGVTGPGFAILAIDAGQLRGTDFVGGKWTGTARRASNRDIDLDLQLKVVPGVSLVDGTGPESFSYVRHIKRTFSESAFGNGEPQTFQTENGTVIHFTLCRISERYSPSADGFIVEFRKK